MERPRILLYDLCSPSPLARTLLEFLESFFTANPYAQGSVKIWQYPIADNAAWTAISDFDPDVIFIVLSAILLDRAREAFVAIRHARPVVPVFVVAETGEPSEMLELLKLGARDFVTPPFKPMDLLPRIWRLPDQKNRAEVAQTPSGKKALEQLVGQSRSFQTQVNGIPFAASCDAGVLILGKTGTGKELFARAIHLLSPRASKPFIPVNCGAIPPDLAENELFGHEKGAFTGACRSRPGVIQEADGGTLFLDEIGSLHPLVQVKLLRFLQEKEYRPLGSTKTRCVNVRVIGATNVELEELVAPGKFRADLFYRLNIIQFQLPLLIERREDIPLLAVHFLAKHSSRFGKSSTSFSTEAMQKLLRYEWPGNVRELEYCVERSVVFCQGSIVQAGDIFLPRIESEPRQESFKAAKAREIARFEKLYLQNLLQICRGNITQAAREAQKNRRAFWQLIRKHRIDVRQFKRTANTDKWMSA